jgi:predicted RNA-binding Zn-ribbon protein involved in translation (DUF1610 family)
VSKTTDRRGPAAYRLGIALLGALLTVLLIWLLGFILRDIDRIEGPDWSAIEAKHVERDLIVRRATLATERERLASETAAEELTQAKHERDRESAEATITVLRQLEGGGPGVSLSPELQKAVTDNLNFFLGLQEDYRNASLRVTELRNRLRSIELESLDIEATIKTQSIPAQEEYAKAWQRHQYLRASLKLAFLIPLFLVFAFWALKKRTSPFRTLPFSGLAASAWKVGAVMHEHFPSEVFKYIAIGAGIAVVLAFLVGMILLIVAPRPEWLHRQRREAYRKRRCPTCADPIRFDEKELATTPAATPGEVVEHPSVYTCPACGDTLFERCPSCGKIRHALLPYCSACGVESTRTPEAPTATR